MSIPAVRGEHAVLPPGRHSATMDEMRAVFVEAAPFSEERAVIFGALESWLSIMATLIPNSRYWVNGGFVTHKAWAPPKDVDVVVLCAPTALNALDEQQQITFDSLLTEDEGGRRIQPMGGLVDGFYTIRGTDGDGSPSYWNTMWSRVKGPDGEPVLDLSKGFVEVIR